MSRFQIFLYQLLNYIIKKKKKNIILFIDLINHIDQLKKKREHVQ